jgi:hypothetical protein
LFRLICFYSLLPFRGWAKTPGDWTSLRTCLPAIQVALNFWYNQDLRVILVSFRVSRDNVGSFWLRSVRYVVRRLSGFSFVSARLLQWRNNCSSFRLAYHFKALPGNFTVNRLCFIASYVTLSFDTPLERFFTLQRLRLYWPFIGDFAIFRQEPAHSVFTLSANQPFGLPLQSVRFISP